MPIDMLAEGSAWLDGKMKAYASRPVVFEQGATQVPVQATIGRTEFEQLDQSGIMTRIESRDFLIDVLDLGTIIPRSGNKIRETDGTKTHIYEVLSLPGIPPFRYSDPYRRKYRIHTKRVGESGGESVLPPISVVKVTNNYGGVLSVGWEFATLEMQSDGEQCPQLEIRIDPFTWIPPTATGFSIGGIVYAIYGAPIEVGMLWRISSVPLHIMASTGALVAAPQSGTVVALV